MQSQEALVKDLESHGWLTTEKCRNAMARVDRANFVEDSIPTSLIYADRPLPNGPSETISAPHMHATALEVLASKLKPGARVLDVGSGSGYLTAAFAYACHPKASVLGLEKHTDLAEASIRNIGKQDKELLDSGQVVIRGGNALGELEMDDNAQFDAVHVGAAAAVMPDSLCQLLAPGGRMLVPIGAQQAPQVLSLVERAEHEEENPQFVVHKLMSVQYVPLTPPTD